MKISIKKVSKLIVISLAIILSNSTSKAYAKSDIPQVDRIVAEYAGVREGQTQTFDILSKSPCNIQYRVWLCNRRDNVWHDITKGYTPPMQPKSIYSVRTPKLKEGEYTISVWVKRYGARNTMDKRGFDSYLSTNMNCLKDDGKGEYLTIDNFTHNYEVGQTVVISNKSGNNYLYNYNVYDLINRKDITTSEDYKNQITWKPCKEGLYLLKVNIKTVEKVPIIENKEDKNDKNQKSINKEDIKNEDTDNKYESDNDKKLKNSKYDKKKDKEVDLKNEEEQKNSDLKEKLNDQEIKQDNPSNSIDKDKSNKEDKKEEQKHDNEIQYNKVEKNTVAFKLIAIGNPYRELAQPTHTSTPSTHKKSNAIHVKSLVVGNGSEGQIIFIKSSPSQGAGNVGYFYGSLQGIDILKTVGNYYYIETKDYKSLNNVRGYVLKSQLNTVTPNQTYSITVKLAEQKVYVYKGDSLIKTFICSTGLDSTPTPTGVYLIGSRGSLFYSGSSVICYNWVRWNNNFLFHSALYDRNGNLILSEYKKLGYKASHGCIRLPLGDIKWIYNNIPSGTAVIIQR